MVQETRIALEKKIESLTIDNERQSKRLEIRQQRLDGAEKITELYKEAARIRDEGPDEPMRRRRDWHNRVCAVLREHYPEAESGFATTHLRFEVTQQREMLIEEMKKLDGILVSVRHTVV